MVCFDRQCDAYFQLCVGLSEVTLEKCFENISYSLLSDVTFQTAGVFRKLTRKKFKALGVFEWLWDICIAPWNLPPRQQLHLQCM